VDGERWTGNGDRWTADGTRFTVHGGLGLMCADPAQHCWNGSKEDHEVGSHAP